MCAGRRCSSCLWRAASTSKRKLNGQSKQRYTARLKPGALCCGMCPFFIAHSSSAAIWYHFNRLFEIRSSGDVYEERSMPVTERRPVIGIPCSMYPDSWFTPANGNAISYLRAIEAAGGIPALIHLTRDAEVIDMHYARCDAILFAGGEDVD